MTTMTTGIWRQADGVELSPCTTNTGTLPEASLHFFFSARTMEASKNLEKNQNRNRCKNIVRLTGFANLKLRELPKNMKMFWQLTYLYACIQFTSNYHDPINNPLSFPSSICLSLYCWGCKFAPFSTPYIFHFSLNYSVWRFATFSDIWDL